MSYPEISYRALLESQPAGPKWFLFGARPIPAKRQFPK